MSATTSTAVTFARIPPRRSPSRAATWWGRAWVRAVEDQATDRAPRIGQPRPVQVPRMISQGTVEARVAEQLRRPRSLADSVLASGETALTELSNDELLDLVSLRRLP